jgi:hypothetical protein
MSVVAIHQPNFFPWLGYFDKIARSDHFVFLDHVQFQKTGGVWSNRVRLLLSGNPGWVTAPIVRAFHGFRQVNEIEFAANQAWREKLLKTLRASYGRTPFFAETMQVLEALVRHEDDNLARYNSHTIMQLAEHLALPLPVWHWSSEIGPAEESTDLLITLTRHVGGDTYLCGGGAADYQEDAAFATVGLTLQYQHFRHPTYKQRHGDPFVPGLSVIDALMNCGRVRVGQMLRGEADQHA